MTSYEFYDARGQLMALVFSGAVAFLLYTTLSNSGEFVRVEEKCHDSVLSL